MSENLRSAGGRSFVLFALFIASAAAPPVTRAAERSGAIVTTEIRNAIGVAATRLIADVIAKSRQENARYLVLQLDTPGGLVSSTRDIVQQAGSASASLPGSTAEYRGREKLDDHLPPSHRSIGSFSHDETGTLKTRVMSD